MIGSAGREIYRKFRGTFAEVSRKFYLNVFAGGGGKFCGFLLSCWGVPKFSEVSRVLEGPQISGVSHIFEGPKVSEFHSNCSHLIL